MFINEIDRKELTKELEYDKTIETINWLVENTDIMHIKSSGFWKQTLYKQNKEDAVN